MNSDQVKTGEGGWWSDPYLSRWEELLHHRRADQVWDGLHFIQHSLQKVPHTLQSHTHALKTCLEHVLFMIRDGEMLEAAPYNPHRRLSSGWVWRSETRAERAPTPGFQSRSAPDTPSYTHKHTQSSYAKQTSVKGLYNAAHKTHTNSYRLVPIHNDSFWLFPIDTDSFQFILTRIDRFWLIPIHTTDSDS